MCAVQAERSLQFVRTEGLMDPLLFLMADVKTQRRLAINVGNDPNLTHEVYLCTEDAYLHFFFFSLIFSEDHKHGIFSVMA